MVQTTTTVAATNDRTKMVQQHIDQGLEKEEVVKCFHKCTRNTTVVETKVRDNGEKVILITQNLFFAPNYKTTLLEDDDLDLNGMKTEKYDVSRPNATAIADADADADDEEIINVVRTSMREDNIGNNVSIPGLMSDSDIDTDTDTDTDNDDAGNSDIDPDSDDEGDDNSSSENRNSSSSLSSSSRLADLWSEDNVNDVAVLWELSSKERDELIELHERLKDLDFHLWNDPYEVVRFLRARPNNIDAAETMFRNMIEWRLSNNIDTILSDPNRKPSQDLLDYVPSGVLKGYDYDNDPIYLERAGCVDVVGMVNKYSKDEIINHAIYTREKEEWIYDYEHDTGKKLKTMTIILDLFGLNIASHLHPEVMKVFEIVSQLDQNNYPEIAKRIIVIRAPSIFVLIWKVVKHFIDPGVREKMIFTGSKNYLNVLSQYMDLSLLPPSVYPQGGKGTGAKGVTTNFVGGKIQ